MQTKAEIQSELSVAKAKLDTVERLLKGFLLEQSLGQCLERLASTLNIGNYTECPTCHHMQSDDATNDMIRELDNQRFTDCLEREKREAECAAMRMALHRLNEDHAVDGLNVGAEALAVIDAATTVANYGLHGRGGFRDALRELHKAADAFSDSIWWTLWVPSTRSAAEKEENRE